MATIGSLGELPFKCSADEVRTFSDLSRTLSVKWAQHDVIGGKPKLEFVGFDLSSVSFTMRFDLSLGIAPKDGLDRLKRMMENKQYKTLIVGNEILGRFVIESITEDRPYHDGRGNCILATAQVSLKEWVK